MQSILRFERFENEDRPVESFRGHLEDKPSVELANALRPLIVEEELNRRKSSSGWWMLKAAVTCSI